MAFHRSLVLLALLLAGLSKAFWQRHFNQRRPTRFSILPLWDGLRVWIESAEDGFVDQDENLEEGEECLCAYKAFASHPDKNHPPRFLAAGALVRRPKHTNQDESNDNNISSSATHHTVCDAWIADSILNEGGPNLQKLGALQLVDALFLQHLEQQHHYSNQQQPPRIEITNFVIQCNSASDWTCASQQAAEERGFRPLRDVWEKYEGEMTDPESVNASSLYQNLHLYHDRDDDGLVWDWETGRERYRAIMSQADCKIGGYDNAASMARKILNHVSRGKLLQKEVS